MIYKYNGEKIKTSYPSPLNMAWRMATDLISVPIGIMRSA